MLFGTRWNRSLGQQLAGLSAPPPDLLQRHVGIGAQGGPFFCLRSGISTATTCRRWGKFLVNNRGGWSPTWRSLRTGRRMRRPYKDLSTPPSLEAPIAARSLPLQGVIVITCDCLSKFCVSPFAVDKRRYRPPPSNIFLVLLTGSRMAEWQWR